MKNFIRIIFLISSLLAGAAQAGVCTSVQSGNWNTSSTWSCTGGITRPSAGHDAIIVSPHTVTLDGNRFAANLTINTGATLDDNGNDLTVTGSVLIDGTYDGTGNNGNLIMEGAGQTLSGTGTIIDIGRIQIDANTTIPAGSNLNLTLDSEIRVGDQGAATLTIDGTITGTSQNPGNRIIRLDNNNTSNVIINGTLDAPNSFVEIQDGGTLTNNGTVSLQYLDGNGDNTATWIQGANSSLTFTAPDQGWVGVFDASASGNTVTYNGTAITPITPSTSYYNLGGTALVCPHGVTVQNSDPCDVPGGAGTATGSPTLCVNDASNGSTLTWTNLPGPVANDGSEATRSLNDLQVSQYLLCTGYGFAIPAGSTINGITVNLERRASAASRIRDSAMRLVMDVAGVATIQATDRATATFYPTGTNISEAHGAATDLWGGVWTAADINSPNFGAALASVKPVTWNAGITARVDHMPITVSYTIGYTSVSSIAVASTNPTNPATSVSWTVTFSRSVTGVDAADFSLVQGGSVTGASITGVSGSGTTWTVTANTGSGTGTLGLNLVDDDSILDVYSLPLGGTGAGNGNFSGAIYTVEPVMTCLTDTFSTGTLDPSLWTVRTIMGAFTPQVVDVGGGDFRLRLTDTGGNEATFAQLTSTFPGSGNKVVMEIDYFAYGGTGADGIAVTFSDSTVSSTTGGFGGSLGYAPNGANDGFGGGWLGIGLDEYGNFPNPTEGRSGYPVGWTAPATANAAAGFYKTNVSVRGSGSGATGYSLLANTGVLATAVAPLTGAAGDTPYRFRFTLDHSDNVHAYVTVERDTTGTGGSYATLVPQFDVKGPNSGQSAVPANWLVSFTGSTGGATNNHDFKRVRVCANTIVLGTLDHLEIQHSSGAGLTCASNTLTVKACADAACTSLYTGGVSGTLDATGTPTVNWDGTTGGAAGAGFVIPSGSSSVTKDVQVATAGSVVFGINTATVSPVPPSATTCSFGSPVCTFTADTAGFIFSDSATGSGVYTIPTLTSGTAQDTTGALWLRAVKASTADAAVCTPAIISQTVDVDLGYNCDDPNSCQAGGLGNINGTAIAAGGTAVSLTFDVNGSTPITSVRYDDAGQITLTASKTFLPFISGTNVSLSGISTTFVVKPHHFDLSGIQRTALPILVNPAAANALGSAFVAAGEEFSVTVTAKNALNADTKNFGREIAPESVKLTSTLAAGLGLINNPALGGTFGAFIDGVASADGVSFLPDGITRSTPFTWHEVGIITLTPSVSDGDYLGAGVVSGTASGNVGRFFPHHFDTTVIAPMNCAGLVFATACPGNGLVYEVQPFTANAYARSASGGTTQNYAYSATPANNFANAVTLSAVAAAGGAAHGTGSLSAGTSMPSSGFAVGLGTLNTPEFTFTASPDAPSDVFIRANDGEASSLRAVAATSVEGGLKAVSGRIKVSNAHGSEQLRLPIFATVQYYDGLGWVTSSTDSATSFDTTVALTFTPIKAPLAAANVNVVNVGVVTAAAGIIPFTLAVPGVTGSADISIPTPPFLTPATGRITFGVYRGANQFIYMREAY